MGLGFRVALILGGKDYEAQLSYIWLARNGGMEKKVETTIMGYMGTTRRIPSVRSSEFGCWGETKAFPPLRDLGLFGISRE